MDHPRLQTLIQHCERHLESLMPQLESRPSELHAAMRYSGLAPGKRLRPCLVMAAAESVGGSAFDVVDAACAVELVHCFSLIHDDLPAIDNDDLRRGRPTCHVKFGEAIALLAGDAIFALAFKTMSRANGDASDVLRCVQVLCEASGSEGLVGGEVADVLAEGKPFQKADLEFIHARKTGVLIKACCEIGGILGGGTQSQIDALCEFGSNLGLAFQITDDLLNVTSSQDALGKAAGSDVIRNKATYPALYGIDEARIEAAKRIDTAIKALTWEAPLLKFIAEFAVKRMN